MSPETEQHCRGYADAMAWVLVWIKQERDHLNSRPIHPRHTRRRAMIDTKLTALAAIRVRVEAAHKEANEALDKNRK